MIGHVAETRFGLLELLANAPLFGEVAHHDERCRDFTMVVGPRDIARLVHPRAASLRKTIASAAGGDRATAERDAHVLVLTAFAKGGERLVCRAAEDAIGAQAAELLHASAPVDEPHVRADGEKRVSILKRVLEKVEPCAQGSEVIGRSIDGSDHGADNPREASHDECA